ncbi:MAG: UTP--glucose-1-phosphate uridylyltransferase [bacterium]|nr:UTP--glucose-1-phosphate uridylyltransferase [bacterium]
MSVGARPGRDRAELDLVGIITAEDERRDTPLESLCAGTSLAQLLAAADELEHFRRASDNLYERVRALFFLYALHRFHIPARAELAPSGKIPYRGYQHLMQRRFEQALTSFLRAQKGAGPSDSISSALALTYHDLGFQTLANQVRRSVRSVAGNRWMFRIGHPADQPLRVLPELVARDTPRGPFPVLRESTPVRMDLSHSGWSDIFFLGMDYPEGARVLNVSVDLGVRGRDRAVRPPIETYFRVIDEPVLRLTSVDLGATADIRELAEVFDYAKDYLGLLKAAVIAAGIVPPGVEGSGESLRELLERMTAPGHGIEVVSYVRDIPKGSRLAVSTNLLASLIAVCMRATGQARALEGPLDEGERRIAAARAILGEWLGGSGGGWQDSGGLWPGIKLIRGQHAEPGDPEYGVSRGRLLPNHEILETGDRSTGMHDLLARSVVIVHGGMAQNVGPILEMVTEKYLLRSGHAWECRRTAIDLSGEIREALVAGEIGRVAAATSRHFAGPVQGIIPWATNLFTETVIERSRERFGDGFLGFCMLGGMSGGGMAFLFDPNVHPRALDEMQAILSETKRELDDALPFAIEPVVYDFAINEHGTSCERLRDGALLPRAYYTLVLPALLRADPGVLTASRRDELERFGAACRTDPSLANMVPALFDNLIPEAPEEDGSDPNLTELLDRHGFDRALHETIRADLRGGHIGLAQNRLPMGTRIDDVLPGDVCDTHGGVAESTRAVGAAALARGDVAVVTLAAGAASRWTQGAGVVKALSPFCQFAGRHRSFLDVHLAKSAHCAALHGAPVEHIVTTSLFTHEPIAARLARSEPPNGVRVSLSPGKSIGLRMVPMTRDLRFMWEELQQRVLDEQAQKVRESLQNALIGWARTMGEGADYTDNLAVQCLHPVGHWFEIPNLLQNGVLADLLERRPGVKHLFLHNIDTLGASLAPDLLGVHIERGSALTFEVIPRRIEDRGGGLARVHGRPRIVEGLALPREEDEFRLTYYNSNSCWIDIDALLGIMGLDRADLRDRDRVRKAIRALGARIPTYVTLKDVKKRWGNGQEDVFPVAQFEKLWVDMTTLPEVACTFAVVPRARGQQLKDTAQLDGWVRDGSAEYVDSLCSWV